MVFDERRFDHHVAEILLNAVIVFQHVLDDRLIVGNTPSDKFQQIVVAAAHQMALDDLVDALRDYAADWNDHLHIAANHEANWAVAALVELSTDEQLRSWLLTFDANAQQ